MDETFGAVAGSPLCFGVPRGASEVRFGRISIFACHARIGKRTIGIEIGVADLFSSEIGGPGRHRMNEIDWAQE